MSERIWSGNRAGLPRLFVVRLGLVFGWGKAVAEHGRADIEQPRLAQLLDPGQFLEAVEAEMREKMRRRHPVERPARAFAPALGLHPARFQQPVERAACPADAAD